MTKITLKIEGMHCGACATGIQMLVSSLDGVQRVFVDYDKKEGEFEFDEGSVSLEKIISSIEELGYKAIK